jgi:hypothetical protein
MVWIITEITEICLMWAYLNRIAIENSKVISGKVINSNVINDKAINSKVINSKVIYNDSEVVVYK